MGFDSPYDPPMKIIEDDYHNDFIDFAAELQSRLRKGADEYENKSFSAHPITLLREIEEELLDVANWSFILFKRIRKIKKEIEKV